MYAAVSQLVESPLCGEALNVLEAVLQSCSTVNSQAESVPTIWPQENGGTVSAPATYRRPDDEHINSPQRPASALVSQSSFKSRSGSGPLQHSWVGSDGPLPSAAGNSPVATADVLPSRYTLFFVLFIM